MRELLQLRQSILENTGEFKKQKVKELKQNWREMKMHGQFVREMPEKIDVDKTCKWLSKSDLKIGTENLLCAAQEQAIRTNYVKHHIDKTSERASCADYMKKR